ncbi:GTP-binding protein [Streptomyces marianii]|uniref:ATP-binding protein n=1 Tax=Streptomyces marianii TaxID=1817406 RepID=A0A5R9DU91_9ACTN|nr:ATP/GTP-binding protein [Streptomyces marianii]TLQ39351.1 ATP-binding protein [Streptomyces marianii]
MVSSPPSSSPPSPVYLPDGDFDLVKILIVGPFGIGKTTAIETVSEIRSLHTEEPMTQAAASVDDLVVDGKDTTTVALDFGRLTLPGARIVLYLFGTPGQERFRVIWEDIAQGALGALVLVDTRRLGASFEVMDLVEEAGLDYVVALNQFPDTPEHELDLVRKRLDLEEHTPLVTCDARDRTSVLDALRTLADHLVSRAGADLS